MKILKKIFPLFLAGFALQAISGEMVDESLSANDISQVIIENRRGEIEIIGWQDDTVTVKGELDEKAKDFIFEKSGSQIKIKVIMPHNEGNNWNSKGSKLKIKLPIGVHVNFEGVSSDVSIIQTQGSAEIQTVSGNITASDLTEHVELSSVSGNVASNNLSGKIRLSSISGDIKDKNSQGRLQLKVISGNITSNSIAKEVFVNTVSGDAEITLADVDELVVSTVSGDMESELSLNDNGVVKLSSVSGDFELYLQEDVQASFRLSSNAGGDFDNRLTSDKTVRAKYGPSAKLNFETGNASASVKASTVSGTVKIARK